MKSITFINTAIMALIPLLIVSCDKAEFEGPVGGKGKTVDITIRSVESKTVLDNDCSVFWEEDDWVTINDDRYRINVDATDRSVATVTNVYESTDGYLAMYPYGGYNYDNNVYIYLDSWVDYRHGNIPHEGNPMIAYSNSTELYFNNIASIVKIGVYGEGHSLKSVIISGNNDEYMSGAMLFNVDDIKAGNFSNYWFDEDEAHKSINLAMDYYYDEYDNRVDNTLVLTSDPQYIYAVIPARTYTNGFTVKLVDTEDNVCIKKTEKSFEAVRSDIKTMAPFEFVPIEVPVTIDNITTTPTSVQFTANGIPEELVMASIISKDYWETIRNRFIEEDEYEDDEALARLILEGEWHELVNIGAGGTVDITLDICWDEFGYVPLRADKEYILLSSYAADEYTSVGEIALQNFTTSAPEGAAPAISLSIAPLKEGDSWNTVRIHVDTDATKIFYYFGSLAGIEADKSDLNITEDRELVSRYGEYIWDKYSDYDDFWTSGDIVDYEDYVGVDYRCLVLALSDGGVESFASIDYQISFMPDATWTKISDNALFDCGSFNRVRIYSGDQSETLHSWDNENFFIKGLTVEKMDGYDIFRIKNLFSASKSPEIAAMGFTDKEGDYYTYIDAGDHDSVRIIREANDMGIQFEDIRYIYYGEYGGGNYDSENGILYIDSYNYFSNLWNESMHITGRSSSSILYFDAKSAGMKIEDFVMDDNKTSWQ